MLKPKNNLAIIFSGNQCDLILKLYSDQSRLEATLVNAFMELFVAQ